MSTNRWMDKQNVLHALNRLVSHKKKILIYILQYGLILKTLLLSEINQPQKDNIVWFHLYEILKIDKFRDRKENRIMGTQGIIA